MEYIAVFLVIAVAILQIVLYGSLVLSLVILLFHEEK